MNVFEQLNLDEETKHTLCISKRISVGVEKYKQRTLIERYALYLDMLQLIEYKIKQTLILRFEYSFKKIGSKTLKQILPLLHHEGLNSTLIDLLKSNIQLKNQLIRMFWIDQSMYNKLDICMNEIDPSLLDQAIMNIEHLCLLWDYCDIRQIYK